MPIIKFELDIANCKCCIYCEEWCGSPDFYVCDIANKRIKDVNTEPEWCPLVHTKGDINGN